MAVVILCVGIISSWVHRGFPYTFTTICTAHTHNSFQDLGLLGFRQAILLDNDNSKLYEGARHYIYISDTRQCDIGVCVRDTLSERCTPLSDIIYI